MPDIGPTADGIVIGSATFYLKALGTIALNPVGPSGQTHRSELSAATDQEVGLIDTGPICGAYDPELASALGIDLA